MRRVVASVAALVGLVGAGTALATTLDVSRATAANPLVGTWQRTNSCTAFVDALTHAGLQDQITEWLVGAGYFHSKSQIDPNAPCKGARNLKHSHFFTSKGKFGSRDQAGNQVDDGDYKIVAPGTLAFPSHVRDFGYKIKVDYVIKGGKLRFDVVVPRPCPKKCHVATAWAISAFYPGPAFTRSS
jgi:hypothetical protein